jgi:hypothetical protein
LTSTTNIQKNYLGIGSHREGSVELEIPHRVGIITCITKGKGSGQGDGSVRHVGSRDKGHAIQVPGEQCMLHQYSVGSIGTCVDEALGCIDSRRRL